MNKKSNEIERWKEIVLSEDCFRYQSTGGKFPDVLDEVSHGEKISRGTMIWISKLVHLRFGGNLHEFFPYKTKQGERGFIRSDVIFS
jgi:hypothetical protein